METSTISLDNLFGQPGMDFDRYVSDFLAGWEGDFDEEAIVSDLIDAIQAVLPAGITTSGAELFVDMDVDPTLIEWLPTLIEDIDFTEIVMRHAIKAS